jgi:NADH-quinone oxidoreductase subunit N
MMPVQFESVYLVGLDYVYSIVLIFGLGTILLVIGASTFSLDRKTSFANGSMIQSMDLCLDAIATSLVLTMDVSSSGSLLGQTMALTESSSLVLLLLFVFSAVFFIIMFDQIKTREVTVFELSILVVFSIAAVSGIVVSTNLIVLYLFLELSTLSGLVIVAIQTDSPRSSEAALKYFIMSALTTGAFLLGCTLMYFETGTLSVSDLSLMNGFGVDDNPWAVFLIVVSFLVKLGVAPFHHWAPDVYDGSPFVSMVFLNIIPKLGRSTFAFTAIIVHSVNTAPSSAHFIQFMGLTSLLFGTFGALFQVRLKRFMAYSSIAHMGYMVIALGTPGLLSYSGSMMYMMVYLVTSFLVWFIVTGSSIEGKRLFDKIADVANLATTNPTLFVGLSIGILSMASIPPFAGFMAKFYVLMGPVQGNSFGLVIIALLLSVVSTFLYLRLIVTISFGGTSSYSVSSFRSKHVSTMVGLTVLLLSGWMLDIDISLNEIEMLSSSVQFG